jgi:hypothetical protein
MFELAELSALDPLADEAALIEQITELERVKSAAAAGQARAAAALDERRRADEAAAGVARRQQGRGVASEIALARRDSPARGGRHLGFAKALVHEMPYTMAVPRRYRFRNRSQVAVVGNVHRRGPRFVPHRVDVADPLIPSRLECGAEHLLPIA